jgi:hypothetical protein
MPRPQPHVVARWGDLVLQWEDQWNWCLTGDGQTTYHCSLPTAMMAASFRVANVDREGIESWLTRFSLEVDKILRQFPDAANSPKLPDKQRAYERFKRSPRGKASKGQPGQKNAA